MAGRISPDNWRGSRGLEDEGKSWEVGLQLPHESCRDAAATATTATSGPLRILPPSRVSDIVSKLSETAKT